MVRPAAGSITVNRSSIVSLPSIIALVRGKISCPVALMLNAPPEADVSMKGNNDPRAILTFWTRPPTIGITNVAVQVLGSDVVGRYSRHEVT
jgi:hypothetical protein